MWRVFKRLSGEVESPLIHPTKVAAKKNMFV